MCCSFVVLTEGAFVASAGYFHEESIEVWLNCDSTELAEVSALFGVIGSSLSARYSRTATTRKPMWS